MQLSQTPANPDPQPESTEWLAKRLQSVLAEVPLHRHRELIEAAAQDLDADVLHCAAALLHLLEPNLSNPAPLPKRALHPTPNFKMIRYRLDVGSQHDLTLDQLKKVLVDESGVDKNNIGNISIRNTYTLIDLPDAMPQDIYQHLKSVEINQRKLDIKRVKSRKKRHGNPYRNRVRDNKPDSADALATAPDQQSAHA